MIFKYPANSAILTEARMYALESINCTVDYEGWKDCHKKMCRITTGKYAQLWLSEFCRLNEIPYKKDKSSPYLHDKEDIEINGHSIDCKVSTIEHLVGQVSPHVLNQENIDFYVFFLTNDELSFIAPYGLIRRKDFIRLAKEIKKGEQLPGTKIIQKFNSSFFISTSSLLPFESSIKRLGRSNVCQKIAA